jgi:Fe/S biogenesis protein NfuA
MSIDAETTTVVRLTDGALERILDLRSGETDAETLALRVEVTGSNGADYTYDLSFEPVDEVAEGDHVDVQGALSVVIPVDSVDRLAGATLDLPANPNQGGLVLRNPNRPNPLGDVAAIELTGELAEKVQQLLEGQINPALASHGGMAELVGVEDDPEAGGKVYIRMGGGCQGCSLSMMTLRDGITTMIKDALPEVAEVIDVTDHAAGENPFYS